MPSASFYKLHRQKTSQNVLEIRRNMISLANAIEFVKFLFELANGIKRVLELHEKITASLKRKK